MRWDFFLPQDGYETVSVSWGARASGRVVPHGPWKWNLKKEDEHSKVMSKVRILLQQVNFLSHSQNKIPIPIGVLGILEPSSFIEFLTRPNADTSVWVGTLIPKGIWESSCLEFQFSSVAQLCLTLCDPMDYNTPGFPVHHQLPEFTQTHVHWVGDTIQHLILCRPLLLLPSIFPSIRVFSSKSVLCIRWPKYWSFSFNISPSNEHPGPISFRMDWLDLLAVQGTLKSLLQKASILWHSAFFIVQLSHPYMTTEKP